MRRGSQKEKTHSKLEAKREKWREHEDRRLKELVSFDYMHTFFICSRSNGIIIFNFYECGFCGNANLIKNSDFYMTFGSEQKVNDAP